MKTLRIGAYLIGAVLAGAGAAMAISNPAQPAYDDYATQKLTAYLQENACTQVPSVLGNVLKAQCAELLASNQGEVKRLITNSTDRQNYLFLSVYKTDLSLNSLLPSYHFETVGVFQQFYTIKAEKR